MMKKTWLALGLMVMFLNINARAKELNAGPWKFMLRTTNGEVPFIVDFKYENKKLTGVLHNGTEIIPLNEIKYENDTLSIPLQNYEVSLELVQKDEKTLAGDLVRHNKNPKVKTPVLAVHGISKRFEPKKEKPRIDLTGKWALQLEDEQGTKTPGIANLKQEGSKLTGSILTPTGDYRYLDGQVWNNKFEAASFDGVYNYVFRGSLKKKKNVEKMEAKLLSNSGTVIKGKRDPNVALPDAYKQTELKELKFNFPDLTGKNVTLDDPKFKNRPVIVQIYGSWCPNCIDEMNYLIPWYKQNSKRGIEIIALAFERSLSADLAKVQLRKVQKKMNVPYTILQAGSTSEDKPAEKLSGIKNFISFPTTIFLNRKHEVVKVHAGFNGPSTGEYFETWKKEFNHHVDELLK